MVAPAFAAVRRAIAEKIGLGNKKAADAVVAADAGAGADAAKETELVVPVVATSRKRVAKAPVVNPVKAPARKAKATAKPVAASADTVTASVPQAATSPVGPKAIEQTLETSDAAPAAPVVPVKAPSSGAKLKKQPAKRMARTPKPAGKSEASGSVSEESLAAETTDAPAVAEKSKRRGKLGLFGKEAANPTAEGKTATPGTGPAKPRWKRPAAKAK